MRFHILPPQHTQTNKDFSACAYTMKVRKFAKMMSNLGHTVIHYGHEYSDVPGAEHVTVLPHQDWLKSYGKHDYHSKFFKYNMNDHAYQVFNRNAIREINTRLQQNDFLLPFWGYGNKEICDAVPNAIVVEPGIGYAGGSWARWKVFESYAILHAYSGTKSVATCDMDYYHTVIPNYFDVTEFDFAPEQKEDYFLFIGRVYSGKGIDIAIQTTEKIGAKLVIAGQNPENLKFPSHVEFVGYADIDLRRQLMSKARAAFAPSLYLEPFGGVQVEMLLSGTPTITTDWGSFTENNIHGITGYRCRTFNDFVWAAKNIDNIDPHDCRKFGLNFVLEQVGPQYEHYFQSVLDVYTGKGWYQTHDRSLLSSKERNI